MRRIRELGELKKAEKPRVARDDPLNLSGNAGVGKQTDLKGTKGRRLRQSRRPFIFSECRHVRAVCLFLASPVER